MMKKMLLTAVLAMAAMGYWAGLVVAEPANISPSTPATQPATVPDRTGYTEAGTPDAHGAGTGSPATSQSTSGPATGGGTTTTQPAKGLFDNQYMIFIMIGGVVLLYIFMSRGRKKQEAKQKQMLATLKKGDKVTTIGGVIGTAVEVRDDEVIVKVDESSNARMRFARWAIRGIGEASKTDNPADKK